ncbi:PRC-barrel domain-containing protein [Roseitranquillus sediminis]|uniref:PRC-barrel domain-containing protein n=1 Tax=Roseitranquillus sediminis TaxID=2809051 RepID=UPI001D0C6AC8|nr:PRC-barrel domain-containing protein [Roseitranquillus sediminis]MBM9596384.1 PRC-barrel domain-containing protein [Roseitranquillus sediminis]
MRKLLLTTALIMPIGAGAAFAQEAQTQENETVIIQSDQAEAGETVEGAAEEAGAAVEQGAEAAGEAVQEGAEAAGDAVEGAAENLESEMQEVEVETETVEGEMEAETVEGEMEAEGEAQLSAEAEQSISREQAPNELRVDWITGASVSSPDGENIGDVNDLILDRETGQLTAAVIGVGGFLGIGEKQIAVNWDDLQVDYDANEITSNLTREEADAAPEYVFRDQEDAPAATGMEGGGTAPLNGMAPAPAGGVAPADGATPPGGMVPADGAAPADTQQIEPVETPAEGEAPAEGEEIEEVETPPANN